MVIIVGKINLNKILLNFTQSYFDFNDLLINYY